MENSSFMELDLDSVLTELTDTRPSSVVGEQDLYTNLIPMEYAEFRQDEPVPYNIQNLMSNAMNQMGISEPVLFEDDDALLEMDQELGPDITRNEYQQFPNFEMSRKKKKKLKRSEKGYSLPDHLNEMMKKSNLMYIQGREEDAIQILKDVIKERADAHEAWLALAMIYNALDDIPRMMQCKMMAAHLSNSNSDLWKPLGYTSKEMGELEQAIYCFRKAIHFYPTDTDSYWQLAQIYLDKELVEPALATLLELVNHNPYDVKAIKEIAKLYVQKGKAKEAIELFLRVMDADVAEPLQMDSTTKDDEQVLGQVSFGRAVCPQRMGYEELNILCELYIETQDYGNALDKLLVGVNRLQGIQNETEDNFLLYDIPVELHVKFAVCYLWLGQDTRADQHLDKLYNGKPPKSDLSVYAEQFYEVSEVFVKQTRFRDALEVLSRLVDTEEGDRPYLWITMGEVYAELGKYEESISMYQNAFELDPHNKETRNALILMYEEMGQDEKAHELLFKFHEIDTEKERLENQSAFQTPYSSPKRTQSTPLSKSLITLSKSELKKFKKPKETKKTTEVDRQAQIQENRSAYQRILDIEGDDSKASEYMKLLKKLLDRFDASAKARKKNAEELNWNSIKGVLVEYPDMYEDDPEIMNATFEGISYQEWYGVIIKAVEVFTKAGKLSEGDYFVRLAMSRQLFFNDPLKRYQLTLLAIAIHVYSGDYSIISTLTRWFGVDDPYNVEDCRMHSGIFPRNDIAFEHFSNNSHLRYYIRRLSKITQTGTTDPKILGHHYAHLGHFALESKQYFLAINYYQKARKLLPNESVIPLSLGVVYLQRSTQKQQSRPDNILKAFAYLKVYQNLRGECEETNYNIARAYHHLGLNHLAIRYYEKVLRAPTKEYSRAAAYNLSMIYYTTGSPQLAQRVLFDHSKW